MAAITRREWSDLKTEHILRAGRENDPNYGATDDRAEQFLTAAYFHICKTWHHLELDSTSTALAFSTSNNEMDISTLMPCIVFAVELQSTGSAFIKMLVKEHARSILNQYSGTAAEPDDYAQYGENLYVDKKPDLAYKSRIFYYDVEPIAPDFSTGSPDTGWAWDELILDYSVFLSHQAIGRSDLAQAFLQTFKDRTAEMPQALLSDVLQVPRASRSHTDQSHAGASG